MRTWQSSEAGLMTGVVVVFGVTVVVVIGDGLFGVVMTIDYMTWCHDGVKVVVVVVLVMVVRSILPVLTITLSVATLKLMSRPYLSLPSAFLVAPNISSFWTRAAVAETVFRLNSSKAVERANT